MHLKKLDTYPGLMEGPTVGCGQSKKNGEVANSKTFKTRVVANNIIF